MECFTDVIKFKLQELKFIWPVHSHVTSKNVNPLLLWMFCLFFFFELSLLKKLTIFREKNRSEGKKIMGEI